MFGAGRAYGFTDNADFSDSIALKTALPKILVGNSGATLDRIAFVTDPENRLNLDSVLKLFASGSFELRNMDELNNFGIAGTNLWFASVLRPSEKNKNKLFFLHFGGTNPDIVNIWIVHQRHDKTIYEFRKTGRSIPPMQRDLEINTVAAQIDLASDDSAILIWQIQNTGASIFAINLGLQKDLASQAQGYGMALAVLIGGLISLMLLSIFLFNAIQDKTYLFFLVQLGGFCLYLFSLHGYGNLYIWKGAQVFDKYVASVALVFAMAASFQVLRRFLSTAKKDPFIDRGLLVLVGTMPVVGLVCLIWYQLGIILLCVTVGLATIGTELAALRFFFREREKSLAFVTGWTILCISSIQTLLANLGLQLPGATMNFFFRADHFGIFAESVLFILALTNRIQDLRLDKEKAEQKNRLKQDFIANISHEMRTPLNGIIGFAESIEHSDHAGEIKFYNRKIISESERLLFQINQLLDLSKIEAGKLDLELKPFSLPQSLAYINSAYGMKASVKNLDFTMSMDSACPLSLIGDRLRLEQILRNLIDNAIKFTESGGVNLVVRVHRQDNLASVLIFDISDTGIGIEQDKLDIIMEDFVQADSSITRRYGGTGLGTSIARRLVEAMDGHIEVKSAPGKGTTFRVYIPFLVAKSEVLNRDEESRDGNNPIPQSFQTLKSSPFAGDIKTENGHKWRVLVVDDLDTNRQVLAIHLRSLPVTIDEAENGEQALDQLATNTYDLVLMDVFMPGMSGHDTTRAIRALYGMALPVIAVTASGFEQDIEAAREAGMNEVLVKPIKRDVLVESVIRHLRNRR